MLSIILIKILVKPTSLISIKLVGFDNFEKESKVVRIEPESDYYLNVAGINCLGSHNAISGNRIIINKINSIGNRMTNTTLSV